VTAEEHPADWRITWYILESGVSVQSGGIKLHAGSAEVASEESRNGVGWSLQSFLSWICLPDER